MYVCTYIAITLLCVILKQIVIFEHAYNTIIIPLSYMYIGNDGMFSHQVVYICMCVCERIYADLPPVDTAAGTEQSAWLWVLSCALTMEVYENNCSCLCFSEEQPQFLCQDQGDVAKARGSEMVTGDSEREERDRLNALTQL